MDRTLDDLSAIRTLKPRKIIFMDSHNHNSVTMSTKKVTFREPDENFEPATTGRSFMDIVSPFKKHRRAQSELINDEERFVESGTKSLRGKEQTMQKKSIVNRI